MASNFVNNSGMVAQALADRSAVNSYQNLMNNINSTLGNLVNNGVNAYQNNKIIQALRGSQPTQQMGNGGFDTSSISKIGSGLNSPILFNQASNDGVSPQAEPVNNGLNYQAGIEQAIKFGRWDVANKLAQTQQNEEETAFKKEKMAKAQEQQDIENDFRERQLNQQRDLAEQKLALQKELTPSDLYRMELLEYNKSRFEKEKFDYVVNFAAESHVDRSI